LIDKLRKISISNQATLRTYKEAGKRLCGYVSNLIPVEIIHAFGMMPVRIEPRLSSHNLADSLLPTFVCEHIRGCLESGLADEYTDLDGTVFTRTCDVFRNLYTLWINNVPTGFSYYLSTPGNINRESMEYFSEELKRFKTFLQKQQGYLISDDDLKSSIRLYNRIRDRLRILSLSGILSGNDLFHLFHASHHMDPQEFCDEIDSLNLENMEKPNSTVKLAITGSHFSDPGIITTIEDLGIHVAILDLDFGPRSVWLNVEEEDDPLKSLANRYIKSAAFDPSKHPSTERVNFLLSLIKSVKTDGIVVMNQKYCDPYLFEESLMKKIFEEEGIPSFFITIGERLEHKQQLINRIEAFVEMIEK
jgi:benzoyl-CoA reductase subunit C